jgi:hypothetical protein
MVSLSARSLALQLGAWRPGGATPLYEALADRIRLLVLDGRISLGTRLPAERLLAEHESLSRTTVAGAYARLRELGYAQSVRGSGTVAQLPRGFADGVPGIGESAGPGMLDLSKATLPAIPIVAEAAREAAELSERAYRLNAFDPLYVNLYALSIMAVGRVAEARGGDVDQRGVVGALAHLAHAAMGEDVADLADADHLHPARSQPIQCCFAGHQGIIVSVRRSPEARCGVPEKRPCDHAAHAHTAFTQDPSRRQAKFQKPFETEAFLMCRDLQHAVRAGVEDGFSRP